MPTGILPCLEGERSEGGRYRFFNISSDISPKENRNSKLITIMTVAKKNPGKYPVPQYALDWIIEQRRKRGKQGSGKMPEWWPTTELTRDLCTVISAGENIYSLDRKNESLPSRQRVLAWVLQGREANENQAAKKATHPDILNFYGQWTRACRLRLEVSIEQMADIEERLLNTPQRIEDPQGRKDIRQKPIFVPNPEALDVQAARTVLENRRWRLSRELPDRFGDKSKVEHSGSVKVERPVDHAPEWMQARIKEQAAQEAAAKPAPPAPDPAPQQNGDKPKTVH